MSNIDKEIQRLHESHGATKAKQLNDYKSQISDSICNTIINSIKYKNDHKRIFADTQQVLQTKLKQIIEDPQLNRPREPIKAFFKGLLGVIISAPFLFVPLSSKQYRSFWFNTKTIHNLSSMKPSIT